MRLVLGTWNVRYGFVLIAFLLGLASAGCGGESREEIPPKEFEAAITRYLVQKGFEMKPAELVKIVEESGETRATWKLKHADSDLGLAVTWEFRFERKNDAWSVVNHRQK